MSDRPARRRPRISQAGWDRLNTIGVLIVAVASLFVGAQTMRETRRMVTAASIPYVVYETGNFDSELGRRRVYLALVNKGVGPARIAHVGLKLDGKPMHTWWDLLQTCCGATERNLNTYTDIGPGAFLSPRERVVILALEQDEQPTRQAVFDRFDQCRFDIAISYCYCSVFDECWSVDHGGAQPRAVGTCNGGADSDFNDMRAMQQLMKTLPNTAPTQPPS